MTETPDPYDHFEALEGSDVHPGVYRVVGTPDGKVTLLRLTDGSGTRRRTGHVEQMSVATLVANFEPAENPDSGFRLGDLVRTISNWVRGAGLLVGRVVG